jgi:hypothetical protein
VETTVGHKPSGSENDTQEVMVVTVILDSQCTHPPTLSLFSHLFFYSDVFNIIRERVLLFSVVFRVVVRVLVLCFFVSATRLCLLFENY